MPKARYTLTTKSTVAETGDKSATKSTITYILYFVADTVVFVARLSPVLATKSNSTACRGRHCRQLGRLCRKWAIFVARMSNVL